MLVMAVSGTSVVEGEGFGSGNTDYGLSSDNYASGVTSSGAFGGRHAVNYEESSTSSGFTETTSTKGFSGMSTGGFSQYEAPKAYNFHYQSKDAQGNNHFHGEESDASGTIRGFYGYTDVQGLFRMVDYIADSSGYRASIRTNEPGTNGKENPADVQMAVEETPAGIHDQNTGFRRNTGYRGNGGFSGYEGFSRTSGMTSQRGSYGYSATEHQFTYGINEGSVGDTAIFSGDGGGAKSGDKEYEIPLYTEKIASAIYEVQQLNKTT